MTCLCRQVYDLGKGRIDFDADHLGARHHDITNPDFGQVDHAVQHATLLLADSTGMFTVIDNRADLVF